MFKNELNIYARGGIGINVAGAFRTIGASGIVLDDQLWLMLESPLTKDTKKYLRNISGQEAIPLGENVGLTCRVLSKPGLKAVEQLKDQLKSIEEKDQDFNEDLKEWSDKLNRGIGWGDPDEYAWPMGQTVDWQRYWLKNIKLRTILSGHILVKLRILNRQYLITHCEKTRNWRSR